MTPRFSESPPIVNAHKPEAQARGSAAIELDFGKPPAGLMKVPRLRLQLAQQVRQVVEAINDKMNHALLVLQAAVSDPGRAAAGDLVIVGPNLGANDEIRQPRFILNRRECNSLGGSWP